MFNNPSINSSFWSPKLAVNSSRAIYHQWKMLEDSGCFENFKIAAGINEGLREGWFFADSDAYKWLDAASRIFAIAPTEELRNKMDQFIDLIAMAQESDGYIYTYNQIHFPGIRWKTLLIGHELYCMGHLIEAGVSHYFSTHESSALNIARKAADLVVREFLHNRKKQTDGHEEIELALLKLYQAVGHVPYLKTASSLLERRGRYQPIFPFLLHQISIVRRSQNIVNQRKKKFLARHPDFTPYILPPGNISKGPKNSRLRWILSAFSGKYFQMHAPIRRQTIPVGHSVRFGYLEAATALLARITGDRSLLPSMEKAWERMVGRRMYITGGLGAVPGLEGFGRDHELDPHYAYAETCAALACIYWNWEMTQILKEAKYSDLIEWQLYNAAIPGMGLDGESYLYNNPLACRSGITRQPWYSVPCCPSNLSRSLTSMGQYCYTTEGENIWIHQYIGNHWIRENNRGQIKMESAIPWQGSVKIIIENGYEHEYTILLRLPSWSTRTRIFINDKQWDNIPPQKDLVQITRGYDPSQSSFLPIRRKWSKRDVIALEFEMPIVLRKLSPEINSVEGRIALTRGPVVYCLESLDNPGMDIFSITLDASTVQTEYSSTMLGGTQIIHGKTRDNRPLVFIPYHLWANRGESQMTVLVNAE